MRDELHNVVTITDTISVLRVLRTLGQTAVEVMGNGQGSRATSGKYEQSNVIKQGEPTERHIT